MMQVEIAADYIKNHPEVDKNQDGEIQYVLLEGEKAGHQDAISRTDFSVKTFDPERGKSGKIKLSVCRSEPGYCKTG